MAKLTALVMKVNPETNTMLVVTDAGDFWEVPLTKPMHLIGAQVEVSPPSEAESFLPGSTASPANGTHKTSSAISWRKQLFPLIAACLLLLFIGGINQFFYTDKPEQIGANLPTQVAMAEPAYLVSIDINPSLELWLDDNLNYMGAEALNQEAALILDLAQLNQGTPLVITLQKLVTTAKESQYLFLDQDNLIMATLIKTSLEESADLAQLQEAFEQIEATLGVTLAAEDLSAEVALRTGTKEELADAKKNKTSINKMHVVSELKKRGISVDPERVKGEKIGKLLQETGLPPGQLIKEIKQVGSKFNDKEDNKAKTKEQSIIKKVTELKDNLPSQENQGQDIQQETPSTPKPKDIINKNKPDKEFQFELKQVPQINWPGRKELIKPQLQLPPGLQKKIPQPPYFKSQWQEFNIKEITVPKRPKTPEIPSSN